MNSGIAMVLKTPDANPIFKNLKAASNYIKSVYLFPLIFS